MNTEITFNKYQLKKAYKLFGYADVQKGGSYTFFGSIILSALLVKALDYFQNKTEIRNVQDNLCQTIHPSQIAVVNKFNSLIDEGKTPEELFNGLSTKILAKLNIISSEILQLIPIDTRLKALKMTEEDYMMKPEVADIHLSFKNYFARNKDDKDFVKIILPLIAKMNKNEDLTYNEKKLLKDSLHDLFTCRNSLVTFLENQSDKLQSKPYLEMLNRQINFYQNLLN